MATLKEECGIFGIYTKTDDVAQPIYYGLTALQHRGQESCGIAVNKDREIEHYKDSGLVNEVFNEEILRGLKGNMGVGHVRYSTAGDAIWENTQPLVLRYIKGSLAIAHNGNLLNGTELKKEYEKYGSIFQTTSDTEVIAYAIARERVNSHSIEEAVSRAMKQLKGAYSLIVMSPQKLIAAKDPWGFRPLCMGKTEDGSIVFASESCGLDAVEASFVKELDPGEIVVVENGEVSYRRENCKNKGSVCIFEHIYFARPDSVINHQLVMDSRRLAGEILAEEHAVDADIVIGVPDSGVGAAQGYSKRSGIRLEEGFMKNRYITRTFIKPDQGARRQAVALKLNPIRQYIEGKRVVMVDDSIVRGTTSLRIINALRRAGAKEVHVRISSPPFLWPCFFGTDVPSRKALVAVNHTVEETAKLIGADSLGYLSMEKLREIVPCSNPHTDFCSGCFNGCYPIEDANAIAQSLA